jgi:hypothetical protein
MGGIEREPVTSNSRAFPPILAVLVARTSTDLMDVRSHPLTPRNDEPAGVHGGDQPDPRHRISSSWCVKLWLDPVRSAAPLFACMKKAEHLQAF